MVTVEPQVYRYLKAPLAEYMDARGITVRELQYKVSDHKFRVSHGTIGHLRKNTDRAVNKELAKRISKALGVPYNILFVERTSNVHREVARPGRAA